MTNTNPATVAHGKDRLMTDPNKDALREAVKRLTDLDDVLRLGDVYAGDSCSQMDSLCRDLKLALPAIALLDEVENLLARISARNGFSFDDKTRAADLLAKLQQARGDRG